MAKNTGDGFRRGEVTGRSQFQTPSGDYAKRDTETGRIIAQKEGGEPWKGVRKEK